MSLREIPEQYAGGDKEHLLQVVRQATGDTEHPHLNTGVGSYDLGALLPEQVQSAEEQRANAERLQKIIDEVLARPGSLAFRSN